MRSLTLQVMTRALTPLLLLFSVFLLLRGHNSPGGGFAGGLIAASMLLVCAGFRRCRRPAGRCASPDGSADQWVGHRVAQRVGRLAHGRGPPCRLGGMAARSEIIQHFGTPLIFDLGVYLTVLGAMLTIVF